jgi:hypothetical protein
MRILFFSPFSGIWEFAALEGRVAAALARAGHHVVFVTCGGLFQRHCLVMAAHGLPPDAAPAARAAVCRDCTLHAGALRGQPGLEGVELTRVLAAAERGDVERLIEGLDEQSALALEVDSIPVGRRALYPFLALKKKDRLDLSAAEWAEYRDQLQNTVLAVRSAQVLIDRHRPDAVVSYSSTYSVVAACLEVARLRGIKDYFIEASGGMGSRHYRAILARGGIAAWYAALRERWEQVADRPAEPAHMHLVTEHMLHLFGARSVFVYSASAQSGSFDARARLGASPGQRVLLATMSSYDEWFAAEQAGLMPVHQSAFASQIEWVGMLFEMLRRRPELFLVLRVHPREFPNRRDTTYSAHARRLLEVLQDIPSNCHVNWPDQKLSLYDLAKDVDVVLNAWSSAGKELTLLGLPVVEWAPDVLLYPPEPRYVARGVEEYEACIDRALADGWSAARVRRMYRWCAMEYGAATFESAPPPGSQWGAARFSRRAVGALHRRLSPLGADRAMLRRPLAVAACRRISEAIAAGANTLAHLDAAGAAGPGIEARALRREAGRLVDGLFGALDGPGGALKDALVDLAQGRTAEGSAGLHEVRRVA